MVPSGGGSSLAWYALFLIALQQTGGPRARGGRRRGTCARETFKWYVHADAEAHWHTPGTPLMSLCLLYLVRLLDAYVRPRYSWRCTSSCRIHDSCTGKMKRPPSSCDRSVERSTGHITKCTW